MREREREKQYGMGNLEEKDVNLNNGDIEKISTKISLLIIKLPENIMLTFREFHMIG